MTPVPLSKARLRAQVDAVLKKKPEATAIGIRTFAPWQGLPELLVGHVTFQIADCCSELEMRERLVLGENTGVRQILLTRLEENKLSSDVLTRLARRRLEELGPWSIVQEMFRATRIDSRILGQTWMADVLVELAPAGGYAPAAQGVLDQDTVWRVLQQRGLGHGTERPDALDLLAWTLDPKHLGGYDHQPEELRRGLRDRIAETAGELGLALLDCLQAGHGADALCIGIVCGIVCAPAAVTEEALVRAATRLEKFVGGKTISRDTGRAWAGAAQDLFARTPEGARELRPWLVRADGLLEEIQAAGYAHLSPLSPKGLGARFAQYAEALATAVREPSLATAVSEPSLAGLAEKAATIRQHALATDPQQLERLEMSLRLPRFLTTEDKEPRSLAEAMGRYSQSGAFVDWARTWLRGGESFPRVSASYEALLRRVTERRQRENKLFGAKLAAAVAAGTASDVLFVEDVLEDVVAPLAAQTPVLLLVLDGMSAAVLAELLPDILENGWQPVTRNQPPLRPVLATLPSATHISRTSLLTGKLLQGNSSTEKSGFAAHPALCAVAKSAPVLFHKADLQEPGGTGLSETVRGSLSTPAQRIVGIILNAVDDGLLKSDQHQPRWDVEYLRYLAAVLYESRSAGRGIILTSDHGHVLEAGTTYRPYDAGERWREAVDDVAEGEVSVAGHRVLSASGKGIIVPWSETVRYAAKRNGYHGGGTPQEMVVPLAVLLPVGTELPGWEETALCSPDWWSEEAAVNAFLPRPRKRPTTAPRPAKGTRNGSLFPPAEPPPPAAKSRASWAEVLFASEVFAAQKQIVGRVTPPEDQMRKFLAALEERGGSLTLSALGQRIGASPMRLRAWSPPWPASSTSTATRC
ncbi:MAG: BREX-2 system phosphatase PglZ [Candidatus Schekmanbacteria bacterium]|nr:BREX-2 system phosphatase PglZ [Candidatus Schekmanbacteria bacterium]